MAEGYAFSQVPIADIPRSVFNRSHSHKTTFDAGYLIPFFVDEALPGDTFNVNLSAFARLATPLVPLMDNIFLDFFFFSVPNRLLWTNWQKFMGEQENPGDSTDFQVPHVTLPLGALPGSIFDYFGVPTNSPTAPVLSVDVGAFWSRAYNLIWNEWFRDENLQTRAVVDKDDGPDSPDDYPLRKRGKRHDYFTSCLPWPQKGPGVMLPLGTSAPVVPGSATVGPLFTSPSIAAPGAPLQQGPSGQFNALYGTGSGPQGDLHWGTTGLVADLNNATAATINSLRQAFQIQKLLERDARGGTRYTEILRSHFGVVSPDSRLQRPEFLGGGTIPVLINPVAQTSGTKPEGATDPYSGTPQGNLAGYGVAAGKGIGFSKSFVEHCTLIGLVCARADLSYQQGLPRMFSRKTRYDYYWPAFSHLGEQAVLNKEIYCDGGTALEPDGTKTDDAVFGYQERWAEYRYFPAKVTGKFRSSDPTPVDIWHLAQFFETRPTLSAGFIEENPPIDRVVAVPSEPQFLFHSHMTMKCVRPMPTYSVPGLIDHF